MDDSGAQQCRVVGDGVASKAGQRDGDGAASVFLEVGCGWGGLPNAVGLLAWCLGSTGRGRGTCKPPSPRLHLLYYLLYIIPSSPRLDSLWDCLVASTPSVVLQRTLCFIPSCLVEPRLCPTPLPALFPSLFSLCSHKKHSTVTTTILFPRRNQPTIDS